MKKRMFTGLFVVCLALFALSIGVFAADTGPTYVAQIGSTKYESIQEAVDAAQNGDTIVVIRDFDADCSTADINGFSVGNKVFANIEEKSVTIDLNGKVITVSPKEGELPGQWHVFSVDENGSLTLKDSSAAKTGTISITANNKFHSIAICYADGATLYIEGGNYKADDTQSSLVYSQHEGSVFVSGGNFTLDSIGTRANGSPWIFNAAHNDANYITVTGGTYNADVNNQFWETEVYVPKEQALKYNDNGTWTVVPAVAYVEEHGMKYPNSSKKPESYYFRKTGYASLADAVASANNYFDEGVTADKTNKIFLLKDCMVDNLLEIRDNITIAVADGLDKIPTVFWLGDRDMFELVDENKLSIISGAYNCNVNEWCPDGYAAVENDAGLFEVVTGYKANYIIPANDNEIVYIEGIAADGEGKATGDTHIHPTLDKAIFDWYKTVNGNYLENQVVFDTDVFTTDTAIYGTYENAVVIRYDSDGGTDVPAQAFVPIMAGVTVKEPDAPSKPNCVFDGWWYTEDETEKEFIFDVNGEKVITQSIALRAKWLASRNVSFVTNGGSAMADAIVGDGRTLTTPTTPTKSGYVFSGWYKDEELTEAYDFSEPVTENFTLYAKWVEAIPYYSVTAPEGMRINPAYAYPGATVTVTLEDADMDGVRILDSKGNLVRVNGSNGVFKFIMPYGNVKAEPFALPFDDVSENDYFHDAVIWAIANGITEGTSDAEFSPAADCTRAQMVTVLWRAAGCPEPNASASGFTDVDMDSYYAKAALWAAEAGITKGTGENLFSPDAECTRAQMAVFLSRMTGGKAQGEDFTFSDVAADAYYADAVRWAAEAGITLGTGDGLFSPDAACSRAQMVAFLWRCFNK